VTLKCDLDVAFDKQHLKYGGANDAKLIELFTELEFTRLLGIVKAGAGASAEGAKGPGPEGAPASTDPYLRMIAASKSNAPPSPAAAPALEPPAERGKVVYETVLSVEPIAKMVAEAKKQGEIAIALAVTSEEAMRADVIGVGLASTPGHGIYVPLSHRYLGAPKMLSWAALQEVLVPVLRDASVMKIGHDVKRTIITLEEKGVAVAGSAFDPMVASYLFDPEGDHTLAAIAKRELDADAPKYEGDAKKNRDRAVPFDELEVERATTFIAPAAETALASARRMGPRLERDGLGPLMRDIEMPLLSVLCEMERVGVLVDTAQLLRASKEAEETLAALDAKAKKIVGRDFAIRSRDQLEEILFDELKLPVLKRTPKGGRSTDASVLEELANEHELPAVILDYREMDKLRGTYLEALPRAQNPKTGRIHTRFDQAVAATGRLSSNDPNLQNIPVRSELGKSIRKAFIAAPGARLVSADYSQIELRVLAHLSNDPRLMEAFTADIDVHTHTASVIFEVKPEDVTKEMRGRAKTINFGVIYGMGEPRLARSLGITRKEAGQFIAQYFRRYEGVNRFMNDTVENAKRGEAVRTLTGRRRFLPNLHSANRGLRFEAERIARNTPIQGTAADIIKLAMVAIGRDRPSPNAKMILTVHDELVFEVPENEIADAKRKIVLGMENAMKLRVPLKVDISDGATWADAKA
jgi:DNA polymerase-1